MKKLGKMGFTMIELLVVLLIIGILAAVAAPMFLGNAEKARVAEAAAAMSQIRAAEREYKVKHGTYLAVTSNALLTNSQDDPTPANRGLGIRIGVAKYFSQDTYRVALGSNAMGGAGVTATSADFLITATGSNSVTVTTDAGGNSTGARNYQDVAAYIVQMDNSGHILYTPDTGTTWKAY